MQEEPRDVFWQGEDTRMGDRFLISVAKVGGGTVGRRYEGFWEYAVMRHRGTPLRTQWDVIAEGSDLHTGTPKTHAEAIDLVRDLVLGVEEL